MLMVSPATLRAWAAKGWLVAQLTAGGHRRFLRCDLEDFAARRGLRLLAPSAQVQRIPLRVLVVDDDPSFSHFLRELLQLQGFSVVLAGDGFAAGRQVESFKPDVLLLDLKMPGLNGFDVCQEIKTNPITRHIRIIAVTGFASAQNRRLILAAGAETCLAKPFQSHELLALLGVPTPTVERSPTVALDVAAEIT